MFKHNLSRLIILTLAKKHAYCNYWIWYTENKYNEYHAWTCLANLVVVDDQEWFMNLWTSQKVWNITKQIFDAHPTFWNSCGPSHSSGCLACVDVSYIQSRCLGNKLWWMIIISDSFYVQATWSLLSCLFCHWPLAACTKYGDIKICKTYSTAALCSFWKHSTDGQWTLLHCSVTFLAKETASACQIHVP